MGVLSILAGLQELALRTLQELAKTTTACSNAMNALDAAKADRLELHAVTIPAAGWKKDDHGCYIDLNMPGLTADDSIAVLIEPDSADAARAAVLDSTTQSSADTLRLRAWKMPTEDLHAHYYTIREDILMALGTVAMGVGNYVLPPATADTLGGVMIGDGLGVDGNGKASFEPTTMSAVAESALTTRMKNHFYDKSEADKTNKALQEQIGKTGGNVGQTIPVWSSTITLGSYANYSYQVPDNVDYVVVHSDCADISNGYVILRGATTDTFYSIKFESNGNLHGYNNGGTTKFYVLGYHQVATGDGSLIPQVVGSKKVRTESYTSTTFSVDTSVDYIVATWPVSYDTDSKKYDVKCRELRMRGDESGSNINVNNGGSSNASITSSFLKFSEAGKVSVPNSSGNTEISLTFYHILTSEELSAQTEALAAAQAAQADADALNVDQDYRLTLLELGVTDDETTETA